MGSSVNVAGGFPVYSYVCKPKVIKFGKQLKYFKSTIKSNIELDMTNCDVSMMSYPNFVTISLKVGHFQF